MGLCKKTLRVSKTATAKRKGRGRPQVYSESWKKKVIVLRACGLELKVILDLLTTQGGLAFKAKIRRAQQIIQEYLADGNHRFVPPDKETARMLAKFIRSERPCKEKPLSYSSSLREGTATASMADYSSSSPSGESAWSMSPSHIADAYSREISQEAKQNQQPPAVDMMDLEGSALFGPVNQDLHFPLGETQIEPGSIVQRQDLSAGIIDMGRHFLTRDRLRARLSNASLSSSILSDLVSLIGRRYSCSTFDTTDDASSTALSETVTDSKSIQARVRKALKLRQQAAVAENTALISRCCHAHCCLHQFIRGFIKQHAEFNNAPHYTPFSTYPAFEYPHHWESNAVTDAQKNDALFFAARVGAPAEVLLTLMQSATDLGYVNDDGQTWLHCLDPRLLKVGLCLCQGSVHCSEFECVMSNLNPAFPIDRIDDHGRHFLVYICYSSAFDLSFLVQMIQRYPEWKERVISASRIRDRAGLFLWDYISTHPSFSTLGEPLQSLFRPDVDPHLWQQLVRTLPDEDNVGRTELHRYMAKESLKDLPGKLSPPFDSTTVRHDINRYDRMGLTPLMTFVKLAFEKGHEDEIIFAAVRQLVAWGANINARSQKGATILQFAAKIGAASFLKGLVTEFGARKDVCDDKGHTAAGYLADSMKASQTAKRSAHQLARSIKAARTLMSAESPVDIVQVMQADAIMKALVLE